MSIAARIRSMRLSKIGLLAYWLMTVARQLSIALNQRQRDSAHCRDLRDGAGNGI